MKVNEMFPSKYIANGDLQGKDLTLTIGYVEMEDLGDGEKKPVLYFDGRNKGLVLNRTNTKRVASMHGNDTDGWIGQEITLYPTETEFKGDTVPCIRIRKTT